MTHQEENPVVAPVRTGRSQDLREQSPQPHQPPAQQQRQPGRQLSGRAVGPATCPEF